LLYPYTSGFFVIWQKFKSHPCLVYFQNSKPFLLLTPELLLYTDMLNEIKEYLQLH
jgi:hypothetical protein